MTEYNPDKWTLLRFTYNGETIVKVLGTWSGSYLWGDSWRLNSGITKVEEDGDYYLFYGHSGSVYKCHKDMEGVVGTSGSWKLQEFLLTGICEEVSVEELLHGGC